MLRRVDTLRELRELRELRLFRQGCTVALGYALATVQHHQWINPCCFRPPQRKPEGS